MSLGENIYTHRTRRQLSQGELADILEVSRQSVSKWENNSTVPELDKLTKMSTLFEITLDELVYGTHAQEPVAEPATEPARYSLKTIVGLILLIFGLLGFLLSVFWGDHIAFGEEIGEIVSISIIILSVSILATHNFKILALCALISFAYSVISFGILNINTNQNYIFVSLINAVILVWFIILGLNANNPEK